MFHVSWLEKIIRKIKTFPCIMTHLRKTLISGPIFNSLSFFFFFFLSFLCWVSSWNYPLYLLTQFVQSERILSNQASLCWDSKNAVGCSINSIPSDGTPTPKVCKLYTLLLPTIKLVVVTKEFSRTSDACLRMWASSIWSCWNNLTFILYTTSTTNDGVLPSSRIIHVQSPDKAII